MILILGMQHLDFKLYKVCINGDPGLILTFLRQGQIWSPVSLNGKNVTKSFKG